MSYEFNANDFEAHSTTSQFFTIFQNTYFKVKMSDAARWKATVYVGGLSQMATQSHVLDAFIPFGEIVEVKVPKPDAPNSTESHRGFAYVEYEDAADAKEAIDNMDQSEFFGKVLKVSQAKAPKSAEDGLGSKTAIWEKVFHNLKLIDNATDLSCRKDGWLSNMEQKMRMQYKILVLTLCKDWNNWTLQDQSLNEKGTLIFVTKVIAGIAKAFKALNSRLLVDKVAIYNNHRNIQGFMPDGFPYYCAVLKCTVLPYPGHATDINPQSSPYLLA